MTTPALLPDSVMFIQVLYMILLGEEHWIDFTCNAGLKINKIIKSPIGD